MFLGSGAKKEAKTPDVGGIVLGLGLGFGVCFHLGVNDSIYNWKGCNWKGKTILKEFHVVLPIKDYVYINSNEGHKT